MEDFILNLNWPQSVLLIVLIMTIGYLINVVIKALVGGLDGIVYIQDCKKEHKEND